MGAKPISPEEEQRTIDAYREAGGNVMAAARLLRMPRATVQQRVIRLAEKGLLGYSPVMPGFAAKSVASRAADGAWVRQTKAPGEVFEVPEGFVHKRISNLSDPEGRTLARWDIVEPDKAAQQEAMAAALAAFKEELPRAEPVRPPEQVTADLLNQFTVTDAHFGMLSWREETGADYDITIAEKLLTDWFTAAIELSPNAHTAVLAQLGDLLHHDGHESVTPANRNVLDADSRLQKVIRVVIRTMRRVIAMLLAKHSHVHIIMADANHDPASGAWLREMFAAFYEDEPRVTVDATASTYYCYEWGSTSLFYHHGHKRKVGDVDSVFAGRWREVYGRTKYSYAHLGHRHSDELKTTNLMKVEQHETLAAPDAYAANGGWLSGRSAKVITYSKRRGEVFRSILSAEMVAEWAKEAA
jgi:hypothetical protein